MIEKTQLNTNNKPVTENLNSEKPNESTGIYVRGFVKISDPETGNVIIETAN